MMIVLEKSFERKRLCGALRIHIYIQWFHTNLSSFEDVTTVISF